MSQLFTLPSEINEIFKEATNSLIEWDGLGREVTLVYAGTQKTSCPNCKSNSILGTSTRTYDSSNSNPLNGPLNKNFTSGTTCPVCQNRGFIEDPVPRSKTIRMLVVLRQNSSDDKFAEIVNIADIKTIYYAIGYKDDESDIKACDHSIMRGIKTRRIGPITPMGLIDESYIETYWETVE